MSWIFNLAVAIAAMVPSAALAQVYPSKPVRLIVPFAPGGGTDTIARTIANKLSESLGKPVVVDNRGGAGGIIAADTVAKAAPDGYTLLMGTPGSLTINPALANSPYDTLRDFAPISLATVSPFVLVVHPGVPVSNVKELIALAKAKPNALNYGSGGTGAVAYLAAEQFNALARVQITHVPYKGSGPAIIDLLSGVLQLEFENLPVVLNYVRSGKLKALAVGTQKRSTYLPDVPTMVEAGVPGYEASTASGVLAPAKVPRPLIDRLNAEVVKAVKSPQVRDTLGALGAEPVGSTPEQYREHIANELKRYVSLVKSLGIK